MCMAENPFQLCEKSYTKWNFDRSRWSYLRNTYIVEFEMSKSQNQILHKKGKVEYKTAMVGVNFRQARSLRLRKENKTLLWNFFTFLFSYSECFMLLTFLFARHIISLNIISVLFLYQIHCWLCSILRANFKIKYDCFCRNLQ